MILNIISLIFFVLCFLFSRFLIKFKYGDIVLRILSIVMLLYKSCWYIFNNLHGKVSVPVEISSLSYFLVAAILTFKIVRFYNIASFFGLAAGSGFFLFYIIAGFTLKDNFLIMDFVSSNIFHGFLLIAGLVLLKKRDFQKTSKLSIWIVILGMIVWALLFYDIQGRGITFIYYIIKPTFLFVFNSVALNNLVLVMFYIILIFLFYGCITIFYKINGKVNKSSCYLNGKRFWKI